MNRARPQTQLKMTLSCQYLHTVYCIATEIFVTEVKCKFSYSACIISTFLQIVFAVCWSHLCSDNLTNKATCLLVCNSLLWCHNNTLLFFFCKECLALSNTGNETGDSKIILSLPDVLVLQTLSQTEHTPPMAPLLQDYVYCLRKYMNPAFVYSLQRALWCLRCGFY